MNNYVKEFFHRGMLFAGVGPIIAGIVYIAVSCNVDNFSLSAFEVFLAILSTYILAFVQSGASVFNQVEHWPIMKSTLFHFLSIYTAYIGCYLVNSWIPFDVRVIMIFTGVFAVTYLLIWLIVYIMVKIASNRLNRNLK